MAISSPRRAKITSSTGTPGPRASKGFIASSGAITFFFVSGGRAGISGATRAGPGTGCRAHPHGEGSRGPSEAIRTKVATRRRPILGAVSRARAIITRRSCKSPSGAPSLSPRASRIETACRVRRGATLSTRSWASLSASGRGHRRARSTACPSTTRAQAKAGCVGPASPARGPKATPATGRAGRAGGRGRAATTRPTRGVATRP